MIRGFRKHNPIFPVGILIFELLSSSIASAGVIDRFSLSFGGNWAGLSMKGVGSSAFYNQATNTLVPFQPVGFFRMKISSGPGIDANVLFKMNDRISCKAGALYLFPAPLNLTPGLHPTVFPDQWPISLSKSNYDATFYLVSPTLGVEYNVPFDMTKLRFSASLAYLFGQAKYNSDIYYDDLPFTSHQKISFASNGIGYIFSASMSLRVSRTFCINPNLGYRFLKTGELHDKTGFKWSGMRLDFSGPFVGANVQLKM